MKKEFVTFYSPGTFVSESTTKEIEAWDTATATEMARQIKERYGATPYAFRFETHSRGDNDLDSKITATSNLYYLGGRIETLADVEVRNDPKEAILLANMRGNGIERIIINDNSWRFIGAFNEGDVLLEFKP